MRSADSFRGTFVRPGTARLALCGVLLGIAHTLEPAPVDAGSPPRPVSPGSNSTGAVAEDRCPTFSWSGVPGASGYELAVFRLDGEEAEPVLVTRAAVAGDARAFTPALGDCLERGRRYAWSVASIGDGNGHRGWSQPFLFEVAETPSSQELEHAMAAITRHLAAEAGPKTNEVRVARAPASPRGPVPGARDARTLDAVTLDSMSGGTLRVASAASTPTLGDPSLRVSANVALGTDSNLFKNDTVFLWDDTSGNTSLGRAALAEIEGGADHNTAVGRAALQNTTIDEGDPDDAYAGSFNTAVGDLALQANTTGYSNTASGAYALRNNTTGYGNVAMGTSALTTNTEGEQNTAIGTGALQANTDGGRNTATGAYALRDNGSGPVDGHNNTANGVDALRSNTSGAKNTAVGGRALFSNTIGAFNTATGYAAAHALVDGSQNTAIGYNALLAHTTGDRNLALGYRAGASHIQGNDNVFIANDGAADDANTIRIGNPISQTSTFVAGIFLKGTAADAAPVLVGLDGKLGTEPSSRELKRDIQDLGSLGDRLLDLRPVAFRFHEHVEHDPDTPLRFGLIAEEVAEVFPELVVYDGAGKPATVQYHLLTTLLLGQLQRQDDELAELRYRLAVLESGAPRLEATRSPP